MKFDGAETLGEIALDLHIEGLELHEFSKTYVDYTKEQIIEVFEELELMASEFEQEIAES